MNNLRKMGKGIVILASVLAIADSASAINLTISSPTTTGLSQVNDLGQSFINDPAGSGASIFLNDWTYAFDSSTDANNVLGRNLSIYQGSGNGSGVILGTSTATSPVTFAGFNSVKWTFTGGVSLFDNATYTAVLSGNSGVIKSSFISPSSSYYPNGNLFSGTTSFINDTVFQANFSSTPVPFEFEPTGGLAILGGAWLLRRHLKKKSTKV